MDAALASLAALPPEARATRREQAAEALAQLHALLQAAQQAPRGAPPRALRALLASPAAWVRAAGWRACRAYGAEECAADDVLRCASTAGARAGEGNRPHACRATPAQGAARPTR